MIYLFNLLFIPFYYWLITFKTKNNHNRNIVFAFVVCMHAVIFRALANPFNYVDTEGYASGFNEISKMSFNEAILSVNFYTHWGQGYLLFNWIIGRFTQEAKYLFIVSSFIGVIPVVWFYYKTSYKLLLPILMYLSYPMMYYMGFGVLREHLAVPFTLLSLYYIDRLKISVPLAITAMLFHTSAIIIFPFYFWKKLNFSSKNVIKTLSVIFLAVIVMRLAMGYVLSFMPKYEAIVQSKDSQNNIIPVLLLGLVSLFIYSLDSRKISGISEIIRKYIYYGFVVSLFSIGIAGLGRLTIYFIYVIPVAVSLFMAYNRNVLRKSILFFSILLIYIRQIIYFTEVKNFEYTFFWE